MRDLYEFAWQLVTHPFIGTGLLVLALFVAAAMILDRKGKP